MISSCESYGFLIDLNNIMILDRLYYKDKIVLITGAGAGIGRALCHLLYQAGATVIVTDINLTNAEETVQLLANRTRKRVEAYQLDVADKDAFEKLSEYIQDKYEQIDLVINNAGIGIGGEVQELEYSDWEKTIAVNQYGVINSVDCFYPMMLKQGHGQIVNVASVAGLVPLAGEVSYTASKYSVVGLSHGLRAEGANYGIKINVVCPGKINTSIYKTSAMRGLNKDKALKFWPKGISPEKCASIMLKGIRQNKSTIVVTTHAKVLWYLNRLSPELTIKLSQQYIRFIRKVAKE